MSVIVTRAILLYERCPVRKHEYEKHGTCASILPQFRDQYDFFSCTMNIRNKLDFYA